MRVVFLNACSFLKCMFHPKRFLKSKIKMLEPLLNYLGSLVLKVIHVTNIHDNVEFTLHDTTFDIFQKKGRNMALRLCFPKLSLKGPSDICR